ncbi:MAG: adenylate/guanylate cyclase domain-containing protein [Nitrososphaerota archaeon]|nr:adenylate/guanylate cyclase domain-containing protein [Nitrososphaerota archaeon]
MAPERRLAAIMFTDIVGYTALAQSNEAGALSSLESHRSLVRPLFSVHNGREVKTIGDAFLLEFLSARDAVLCAFDVQKKMHDWDSGASKPLAMRIGIHLGDVVHAQGDVYGDAVNVASRLQSLAEAGGICVSRQVFESVRNKTDLEFVPVGEKELKNVEHPMWVYRVKMPWEESAISRILAPRERLAVLPFVSMSPDPNDEYFADGLTEELIGRLSQIRGLEVIARTSIMNYKKKEKNVSDIGRELNVGTVIEGSVRKAGNRIRVTVQVIDANTEGHLFSSNYDSNLDDIFAVQSDVAAKVAESVPGAVLVPKRRNGAEKETADTLAYTYFLQGSQLCNLEEEEPLRQALSLLQQVVTRDPDFARAYAQIAKCYIELGNGGYMSWGESIDEGKVAVTKALLIDPDLPEAHSRLGELQFMADEGIESRGAEFRRALALNPNLAEAHRMLGSLAATIGDTDGMVRSFEKAYQLDPLAPEVISRLGMAYFYAGREHDALDHWAKTLHLEHYMNYRFMFDYYVTKGDLVEAERVVEEMEKAGPTLEYTHVNRGYLAAVKGDRKTALEMVEKLEGTHKAGWARAYSAGFIYLGMGDLDKFFEYMFRAAEDHTLSVVTLRYNPLVDRARRDPRFPEVFRRAGMPLPTQR